MKRYLSLFLAIVMMFATLALTACGDKEKTLYERYADAMKALDAVDQVEATMDMMMKAEFMGVTMEIPVTGTIKSTGMTGENTVTRMIMTTTAEGQSVTEDIYSAGGWDYYTSADGNYKVRSEEDEEESIDELLSEETLAKGTVTEKDGITKVDLTLTAEEFLKGFGSIAESFADDELSADAITEAKASFSFNEKDQMTAFSFSFKMEVTEEGISMATEISVALNILKTNGVTVEAPAGYENYESVEEG